MTFTTSRYYTADQNERDRTKQFTNLADAIADALADPGMTDATIGAEIDGHNCFLGDVGVHTALRDKRARFYSYDAVKSTPIQHIRHLRPHAIFTQQPDGQWIKETKHGQKNI